MKLRSCSQYEEKFSRYRCSLGWFGILIDVKENSATAGLEITMIDMQPLKFTANARLKDIIGRGLIHNDNLAILELVKNAKDAGSPDVSIKFVECDQNVGEPKLIIADRGSGMSFDDIKDKWLNIGYSDKRNAYPADGEFYAGSKGIGRFSCDRLGKTLDIYTRARGSDIIALHVDWEDYEVDEQNSSIGDIEVQARYLTHDELVLETGLRDFSQGTAIVIRNLRSNWTKEGLLSLRKELERFAIDPDGEFQVSLSDWRFDSRDEVNQPIANKVFTDLDVRTTSISAKIDGDGREIEIELRHDGDYIFKVQEENPYSEIKGLEAKIYFLNQPAKSFFKRRTGYSLGDYGSVHLFLNGFRISPYGNSGNDWLGINSRESDSVSQVIRTKDLLGFVKLTDGVGAFETVSSREGLVDNLGFKQLTSPGKLKPSESKSAIGCGLIYKLLYKLEKFVIEGLDWDRIVGIESSRQPEKELNGNFEYLMRNNLLLQSIAPVVRCKSNKARLKNITVNADYIARIARETTEGYEKQIEELEEKLAGLSFSELRPSERRDVSKLISRMTKTVSSKDMAIASLKSKDEQRRKKLNAEKKRRVFAERFYTKDNEKLAQINHQVSLLSLSNIQKIDRIIRRFREDSSRYTSEALIEVLNDIRFTSRKISKVANLILMAKFDLTCNSVKEDLIQFIDEYLKSFTSIQDAYFLRISVSNAKKVELPLHFRPAEMTILVDNLLTNAGKAKAKKIDIQVEETGSVVKVRFVDDGIGLTERFLPKDLFENGVTTTSGAGIGLHHVKQIVEEIGGRVSIRNGRIGAIVELEFTK